MQGILVVVSVISDIRTSVDVIRRLFLSVGRVADVVRVSALAVGGVTKVRLGTSSGSSSSTEEQTA